jgi:Subtilisin inhibitor-like
MGRSCKGTVSAICRLALIGACLALISGCGLPGGADDSGSGTSTTASAATDLAVTVWPQGQGRSRKWTLTCDPVGGTLPRPAAACAQLTREALRPLPRDTICTQIYGGPQRARVTGRVDGRAVDARFSRSNGCEIHRWDNVRFLFPVRI